MERENVIGKLKLEKEKMKMKKIFATVIVLICIVCTVTGCTSGENTSSNNDLPEKVVIGTQSFVHDQTLAMAAGYFEETFGEDISVETVVFSSGRDAINAMISGDVDFIYSGSIPAVSGLANGLEAEVIWVHNVLNRSDAVVARSGSGITSIEDLKGKKVAVPFVSTTHYILETGLKEAGMTSEDVEMLDLQPDEIYAAWGRGDIDAAALWDPVLSELEGEEIIYSAGDAAEDGFPTMDLGLVRKDFAQKYPELVSKYTEALSKAEQLYDEDKDEAVNILADALEMSVEDTENQINGSIWLNAEEQLSEEYFGGGLGSVLYNVAEYLYENGNLTELPDKDVFDDMVNASYIEGIVN